VAVRRSVHGLPVLFGDDMSGTSSSQRWDASYHDGQWDYLLSPGEMAHYSAVAGYVRCYCSSGLILDLGCGEGVLLRYLHPDCITEYAGVDFSATALGRSRFASESVRFYCADVELFEPSRIGYDVVVFNEILYLLRDPVGTLKRYCECLKQGGVLIISMYTHRRGSARAVQVVDLWKTIFSAFKTVEETIVVHTRSGRAWRIAVLRPVGFDALPSRQSTCELDPNC
jgi:SAM-dependent methyltransferase